MTWCLAGEMLMDGDDVIAVTNRAFSGRSMFWSPSDFQWLWIDEKSPIKGAAPIRRALTPEECERISRILRSKRDAALEYEANMDWVV